MNNDISGELTNYINPRGQHVSKKPTVKTEIDSKQTAESYDAAQKYYASLGHAKVNMDNGVQSRIIDSINMLKNDPDYVEGHVDFCDFLQQRGYSLEDAINVTDTVFEKLKEESTYR